MDQKEKCTTEYTQECKPSYNYGQGPMLYYFFFFTYKMVKKARVFVSFRPFDPILIFVSKIRSLY